MPDILTLFSDRLILKPIGADARDGEDCSRAIISSIDDLRSFAPWVKQPENHTVELTTVLVNELFQKYLAGNDLFMVARENVNGHGGDWVTSVELYNIEHEQGICSTGYWTPTAMTGKGYTKEALKILIDHGVQNLNLKAIYATCQKINQPSLHILDVLGFKIIAPEDAPEKHRTEEPEISFQLVLKS